MIERSKFTRASGKLTVCQDGDEALSQKAFGAGFRSKSKPVSEEATPVKALSFTKFLNKLKEKSIHIVGVTGSEGSSILRLLSKYNFNNIVVHDFLALGTVEKSFKYWHKGMTTYEKQKKYKEFVNDLKGQLFYYGDNYLKDILKADVIFVPQSWRLYKQENSRLFRAKDIGIPFLTITRLYLDYCPAKIVAVTGTVGKGSVSNILYHLLRTEFKKVYFSGNETWTMQLVDKIDEMRSSDILVLELSHRQIREGFSRAPKIIVLTNIYANHLDELSFNHYKDLKLLILKRQKLGDIAIVNYDNEYMNKINTQISSKVYYYSLKNKENNTKRVQKIYNSIVSKKSHHYPENILAAATTAEILGIPIKTIKKQIFNIPNLPSRLELLGEINDISIYSDIKSTTPWATIRGVEYLDSRVILICGGRIKGIDYEEFIQRIKNKIKYIFILRSELSELLKENFNNIKIKKSLIEAIEESLKIAEKGDKILVSPAASYFYTDFIHKKISLRKIVSNYQKDLQN